MKSRHAALLVTALFAACAEPGAQGEPESVASAVPAGADAIQASEIERHLRTLSADSFMGRSPGTPGGDAAARYIADQFEAAGLSPVDGGWFQSVPMIGTTPRPESARLTLEAGGETFQGDYLEDFVVWSGDPEAAQARADGELVFVGYGIEAPENDWSDYGGLDMTGKVALILVNDPPAPESEPELFGGRAMTYYGRWTYKYEEAARRGAAGAFIIHTTEEAGYGWNVVSGSWSGEQFSLPPDPGAPAPVPVQGWVTHELAASSLAAAGHDLEALVQAAASRDFAPTALGITVSAAVDSDMRRVETQNVVALLEGSERPDEIITVTSHYDHLGVGQAVEGDTIYNGAYDNASGVAMMLATAEAMASMTERPDRSILFIATAAEEQGLLGAEWYVQDPIFPLSSTVAEINVDGANLWGETDDLIAMGSERSGLGDFIERRAREMEMRLAPDAEPEKGFFFRSDHFPFAKAGVPSLYIEHGRAYRGRPEGWGDSIQADYTANRYHGPGDEYAEDFVYEGAVQQARILFLTAWDLAQSDAWPNWDEDSEFRAARDRMMSGS